MQENHTFKTAKVPLANLAGARSFPLPSMPKKATEPAQTPASNQVAAEVQGTALHAGSAVAEPAAPGLPPLTPPR